MKQVEVRKLVENFIDQYRKPFNLEVVCEMIGKTGKQVGPLLKMMESKGRIKKIEDGIYLLRGKDISHTSMYGNRMWRYNAETGDNILKILKSNKIGNIRKLAQIMGVSRQYAYLYLEALASIGAVVWDGEKYGVTGTGDLTRLGCRIDKGILGRMRHG